MSSPLAIQAHGPLRASFSPGSFGARARIPHISVASALLPGPIAAEHPASPSSSSSASLRGSPRSVNTAVASSGAPPSRQFALGTTAPPLPPKQRKPAPAKVSNFLPRPLADSSSADCNSRCEIGENFASPSCCSLALSDRRTNRSGYSLERWHFSTFFNLNHGSGSQSEARGVKGKKLELKSKLLNAIEPSYPFVRLLRCLEI